MDTLSIKTKKANGNIRIAELPRKSLVAKSGMALWYIIKMAIRIITGHQIYP